MKRLLIILVCLFLTLPAMASEYEAQVLGPSVPYAGGRSPLVGNEYDCLQVYESITEPTVNGALQEPYIYLTRIRVTGDVLKAIMSDGKYAVLKYETVEPPVVDGEAVPFPADTVSEAELKTDMLDHMKDKFIAPDYSLDPTKEQYYGKITKDLQKSDSERTKAEQENAKLRTWLETIIKWKEVDAKLISEIKLYLYPE